MAHTTPSRAQISRSAIRRMHVEMRHLLIRGSYKPIGRSGQAMIQSLLAINPEIYGSIANPAHVELSGLLYVFQRLPQGIEQCRNINLISREGYEDSNFTPIIPSKRRRNCYRIDDEQMMIEMTRGGSDVYDVLTHLTFMYNEAEKIGRNALNNRNQPNRTWKMLSKIVKLKKLTPEQEDIATSHLSTLLGRTYKETAQALELFKRADGVNNLYSICYWLGKLSIEETLDSNDREITFSTALKEQLGHHTYGEKWANHIKKHLSDHDLIHRKVHIISANMHSVMNCIYAQDALGKKYASKNLMDIATVLSDDANQKLRDKVKKYALSKGMAKLHDDSGTNIPVQIIDLSKVDLSELPKEIQSSSKDISCDDIILVMDYAFGEQAYETMDELLKPYDLVDHKIKMNIGSINIMGKAGILKGGKGDIMIATAHVFEGSADNYPFKNELKEKQFEKYPLNVCTGSMITVLGTSLQNKDILQYFLKSSWSAIGLEMEGAHYQKAIQVASKIRNSISSNTKLRYAYYASDNPLETGSTLASGSLGLGGVTPTYAITIEILKGVIGG